MIWCAGELGESEGQGARTSRKRQSDDAHKALARTSPHPNDLSPGRTSLMTRSEFRVKDMPSMRYCDERAKYARAQELKLRKLRGVRSRPRHPPAHPARGKIGGKISVTPRSLQTATLMVYAWKSGVSRKYSNEISKLHCCRRNGTI